MLDRDVASDWVAVKDPDAESATPAGAATEGGLAGDEAELTPLLDRL